MKTKSVLLPVIISAFLTGCGSQSENPSQSQSQSQNIETGTAQAQTEKNFNPFVVYKDIGSRENHFVPSGFMPDGKCVQFLDKWQEGCYEGSSCIKVEYDVACSEQGQKWAGVYWLNPANNWGNQKGGYNLEGATELSFWAKGENGGERIEEFKIGGILGDYPDTDMAVIGPVILTSEWRKYTIDLRGKDLSYISGGFSWSTNVDVNPQNCIFYLDNIQYE